MNVLLILASVLLNSSAQVLMKKGMAQAESMSISQMLANMSFFIRNGWLWCAVGAYGLSFILWLGVLAKSPVNFAFPFLSIGYVLVALAGHFLFGEHISFVQIVGFAAICMGVVLISRN